MVLFIGLILGIITMSEAQVVPVADQPKTAGTVVTSENLAEFNANKLGLATNSSPTAADSVDEQSGSEPAATEGQSEPGLADDNATGTEEKKQNPKLEKRFSELTKARKEAEAKAEAERQAREELEARLAALEGQRSTQVEPQANKKPSPDDYKDAFQYAEALAEWSANEAVAKREREILQKQAEAQKAKVIQTWQQKLEATKAELPDYEDMVASSNVVVNDAVRDAIIESDIGPRILYELASDEFNRLFTAIHKKTDYQQAREKDAFDALHALRTVREADFYDRAIDDGGENPFLITKREYLLDRHLTVEDLVQQGFA